MIDEEPRPREAGWVRLIEARAIPLGEHRYLEAEGLRLLVHHLAEGFYVTSSQCPHQDFTMDRCVLEGPLITCLEHGWKIDVRTGRVVAVGDDDERLPTWPAEVREGWVWSKLFDF